MIEQAALVIGVVATALIGLAVFTKDRQSITNRLFVALALSLIGWSITTYQSLHTSTDSQTLHWIRWIMFFVVTQNTSFFLLVQVFPERQSKIFHRLRYKIALAYSTLVALAVVSPLLFVALKNGAPQPGPAMALFMPHALIFCLGGVVALIVKYHRAKGFEKAQLRFFLAGALLLFTIEPAGNFILPLALHTNALVTFSPLYAIAFSGFIAYAIVTQRMFDIRSAVARSVGYVLVMAAMAGIYSVALFGIVDEIFGGNNNEMLRQVLSVILLMPLALSFQYTKNFFDRITNRLFYQETYDLRVVLDDVGNVLASDIELVKVLNGTQRVLSGALKSSFMEYVLIRDGKPYLANENAQPRLEDLKAHLSSQHSELLEAEVIGNQNPLLESLRAGHVALSLRLRTQKQVIGYLLIGDKKNGEIYSPQDRRLLTIVADELAIAIQNALQFEEIQNFNETLQGKVSQATKELRHSNHRLRELDSTKDDFISMASHQLRTPLTSVKGYLSMVLDGDAGPLNDTQRKLLEQSYRSSQQMVFLISDLLNLSRLNTGKFVIEPSDVDLSELVQFEIGQLSETAKARGITLVYDKPAEFSHLQLDETKVHQVVMNFIDNAIYYTKSGGTVTVSLKDTPQYVEYRVTDTGIGVPKAVQHKLFSKFYRADNAQKARPDGTGLGLFMAKKVIAAQGGAIIFESEEGKGSTFGFRFNKARHEVPAGTKKSPAMLHH